MYHYLVDHYSEYSTLYIQCSDQHELPPFGHSTLSTCTRSRKISNSEQNISEINTYKPNNRVDFPIPTGPIIPTRLPAGDKKY